MMKSLFRNIQNTKTSSKILLCEEPDTPYEELNGRLRLEIASSQGFTDFRQAVAKVEKLWKAKGWKTWYIANNTFMSNIATITENGNYIDYGASERAEYMMVKSPCYPEYNPGNPAFEYRDERDDWTRYDIFGKLVRPKTPHTTKPTPEKDSQ